MDQQAAKQAKWKLERSLTPAVAPYVPPNKRGGGAGKPQPPIDLQKRLKAEEAKVKKLEAANKQLQRRGGGGPAIVKPPPATAEVKALEANLATFKAALAAAPDDADFQKVVKATEDEIEKAAPKHEVQTSELQRQLESLQKQIETDEKTVESKLDFATNNAAETHKPALTSLQEFWRNL